MTLPGAFVGVLLGGGSPARPGQPVLVARRAAGRPDAGRRRRHCWSSAATSCRRTCGPRQEDARFPSTGALSFRCRSASAPDTEQLVVGGLFVAWHRSEGTLSIHSITTRRRELFYWATVLASFALGTAAGDFTADQLQLGYLRSVVVFAVAIAVPALAWRFLRLNPVVAFWIAYVLTRPLGASIADWVGKPASHGGGLGFGDGTVAAVSGRPSCCSWPT